MGVPSSNSDRRSAAFWRIFRAITRLGGFYTGSPRGWTRDAGKIVSTRRFSAHCTNVGTFGTTCTRLFGISAVTDIKGKL